MTEPYTSVTAYVYRFWPAFETPLPPAASNDVYHETGSETRWPFGVSRYLSRLAANTFKLTL